MQNVSNVQIGNPQEAIMERVLSSTEARDSFSAILDEVQFQGDKYIISRKGKPAAVLVPLDVYEGWKEARKRFFDLVREFQESSGDNDPDEIMELVLEAQQAVRKEMAAKSQA